MGSEEIRERTKKLLNNLWEKIAKNINIATSLYISLYRLLTAVKIWNNYFFFTKFIIMFSK